MRYSPAQDHQRRIQIAAALNATRAGVPTLRESFLCNAPAGMTALRGFEGGSGGLSIHDTSFCRFVSDHAEKRRRGSVQDRFVQSRLGGCAIGQVCSRRDPRFGFGTPGHIRHAELFGEDRRSLSDQEIGQFMVKVFALMGNFPVVFGHATIPVAPGPRPFGFLVACPIRRFQVRLRLLQEARIRYGGEGAISVRQGGIRLHPQSKARMVFPA